MSRVCTNTATTTRRRYLKKKNSKSKESALVMAPLVGSLLLAKVLTYTRGTLSCIDLSAPLLASPSE